jgi:rhamnogalacturonyl hydrolase YesR
MIRRPGAAAALGVLVTFAAFGGCASSASAPRTSPPDASTSDASPLDGGSPAPAGGALGALLSKVAHYEIDQLGADADSDWINAVFYVGLLAAYKVTLESSLLDAVRAWGARNNWDLFSNRKGPTFADNQCCAQAYLDLALLDAGPPSTSTFQKPQGAFDGMIDASPVPGRQLWYWCDALFMAPGALVRLEAATAETKYVTFLDTEWWDAEGNLLSADAGLFWRDATFFGTRTFWSRGNGWVIAGTARVLDYLPASDARYADYVHLLQSLAATLAPLQGADGLWRADLLNPQAFPNPETSGSGLMAYAMAWGIDKGLLDRATYLPVVQKAWTGLVGAVDGQGRLGWVQPSGIAPGAAQATDSAPYGVGAFLLAGSEVAKLP